MTEKNKKILVKDEQGLEYQLLDSIGRGGQGVVYKSNFENILVKMCTRPKEAREKWMTHIRWLMTQDLDSLKIARPVACIAEPQSGYVMELMDGLVPLQSLIEKAEIEGIREYLQQGGVLRRLKILTNLAKNLAELHGRGMVFGDISPANIFVSDDSEESQVWLIDCDNICINQRMSFDIPQGEMGSASSVYTPYYGAPEVVRGESLVSSLTDSWSFAVIAFRLLTAQHPLLGDAVNEGEPELEEAALRGELPWIDHPSDDSNRSESGLPREMVLLKPLSDLFDRCFNEGKDNPESRPSLNEWAECINDSLSWLVFCDGCHTTYFYRPKSRKLSCDFCGKSADINSLIFLKQYLMDPSIKDVDGATDKDCYIDTGLRHVLNRDEDINIYSFSSSELATNKSQPLYSIKLSDEDVIIQPNKGVKLNISYGNAKRQEFNNELKLSVKERKGKMVSVSVIGNADIEDVCMFQW